MNSEEFTTGEAQPDALGDTRRSRNLTGRGKLELLSFRDIEECLQRVNNDVCCT